MSLFGIDMGKSRTLAVLLGGVLVACIASAACSLSATDRVVFTVFARIQFSVPADWVVIDSRSDAATTVFAFQIKNPADEGTPDSTNLAIISEYLKDRRAKSAFEREVADQEKKAQKKEAVENWNCSSFSAMQGSTRYDIWDCNRQITGCGVVVRLAWPELPKNPADYDDKIKGALTDVLKSVTPSSE